MLEPEPLELDLELELELERELEPDREPSEPESLDRHFRARCFFLCEPAPGPAGPPLSGLLPAACRPSFSPGP